MKKIKGLGQVAVVKMIDSDEFGEISRTIVVESEEKGTLFKLTLKKELYE